MTAINTVEQSQVEAAALNFVEPQYMKASVKVPAAELRKLLDRALNTMEPCDWPEWVNSIMGGHVVPRTNGKVVEGIRSTDECTFVFRRQKEAKSA